MPAIARVVSGSSFRSRGLSRSAENAPVSSREGVIIAEEAKSIGLVRWQQQYCGSDQTAQLISEHRMPVTRGVSIIVVSDDEAIASPLAPSAQTRT